MAYRNRFFIPAAVAILAGCTKPASTPKTVVETPPDSDVVRQYLARKERWAVKTGADSGAARIDVSKPVPTTVASLTSLPRPSGMPTRGGQDETRHSPVETTVYTVDAQILRYKLETDDQDIHIVIKDPDGKRTMIVEVPDPSVVSRRSPFWTKIRDVRQAFYAHDRPTTKFKRKKILARITGVGFFDFMHGQSGLAPNGIELHPVIDIRFQ